MKILITGAAGFIGSHLAERLASMGYSVVGIDNFNDYYSQTLKRANAQSIKAVGVKIIEMDLSSSDLARSLPADFDYIFHCAAQPGIASNSNFDSYLKNNVVATKNLVDFSRQASNLKLFVNIGTSSIYGRDVSCNEEEIAKPISNYGVTKLAAEQLVLSGSRTKDFRACSLRLYSVYGSRERPDKLYTKLINCGLRNEKFPLFEGSLSHKRSFTHVSDIVNGIVSCIGKETQCDGQIINLGIDKEFTTEEGMETVSRLLETDIEIEILPPRNGDQDRTFAVIDKARRLLGYNPVTTLENGLKEQISWAKSVAAGKKE